MEEAAHPVAPRWTWQATIGSAVLALLSHVVGGTEAGLLTGVCTLGALVGSVYLLYRWGQRRDSQYRERDEDDRRRKEMEAEAGGYGGNGGGL